MTVRRRRQQRAETLRQAFDRGTRAGEDRAAARDDDGHTGADERVGPGPHGLLRGHDGIGDRRWVHRA